MLEEIIPARLLKAYHLLNENALNFESWRIDLFAKLLRNVEVNFLELRETIGKDRLPAAAWVARNLLELWIWVKYCGAARDNAWRYHEDALRDMKGLSDLQKKLCELRGIEDETSNGRAHRIKAAARQLGLDDVDANYLAVSRAAAADGVNLSPLYSTSHRFLSKFAHPTAGLVIGFMHQDEPRSGMQAVCTTWGVYFAEQCTLEGQRTLAGREP
jgi:hypothetical protein